MNDELDLKCMQKAPENKKRQRKKRKADYLKNVFKRFCLQPGIKIKPRYRKKHQRGE